MARKATPTKVCTFTKREMPATAEFFYRDKSQKDGLSPWSKAGEAAYNKAYNKALKARGVTRVRDLDDKGKASFNKAMVAAKVRIARTGRVNHAKATVARKRTARAKATA